MLNVVISPAALYRTIAEKTPTLLLDEAQSMSRAGSESNAVLQELFLAGISKKAMVTKCVGQDHTPTDFPVYCPKILAQIGKLETTMRDRSLPAGSEKKKPTEKSRRCIDRRLDEEGAGIKKALGKWSATPKYRKPIIELYNTDDLECYELHSDRIANLLLPLQAVLTSMYGENGPIRILMEYAKQLGKEEKVVDNRTTGAQLLSACREEFTKNKDVSGYLRTEVLISRLSQRKGEPWSEISKGKPISDVKLASLLAEYKIRSGQTGPRVMRVRGYFASDFRDAWERYLPPLDGGA
jgi:hypothetical protein